MILLLLLKTTKKLLIYSEIVGNFGIRFRISNRQSWYLHPSFRNLHPRRRKYSRTKKWLNRKVKETRHIGKIVPAAVKKWRSWCFPMTIGPKISAKARWNGAMQQSELACFTLILFSALPLLRKFTYLVPKLLRFH